MASHHVLDCFLCNLIRYLMMTFMVELSHTVIVCTVSDIYVIPTIPTLRLIYMPLYHLFVSRTYIRCPISINGLIFRSYISILFQLYVCFISSSFMSVLSHLVISVLSSSIICFSLVFLFHCFIYRSFIVLVLFYILLLQCLP